MVTRRLSTEASDGADLSGRGRPPHWHEREGTWDRRIFREVVEEDEYGLPASFHPQDVLVDVGAHVGSFCWACIDHGAERIFAYEVDPANFELLQANLRAHADSVHTRNVAVWRSDIIDDPLFYTPDSPTGGNTGGTRVHNHSGLPVPGVMSFDSVIREAASTSPSGRIRLAKLDVEGSEYPILYTAAKLELIDELVGEYHGQSAAVGGYSGLPPFTMEDLGSHLQRCGFTASWTARGYNDPGFGIFRARRSPRLPRLVVA